MSILMQLGINVRGRCQGGEHLGKVLIVGIGNPLLQDEGLGIHAVQRLQEMSLPPGVVAMDGGTFSLDLLDYFAGVEQVIIVDALLAGQTPGTIYRIPLAELEYQSANHSISMHDLHFLEAIQIAGLRGHQPQVVVFGVEPSVIDWGVTLSPEVEGQLPRLLEYIRQEIEGTFSEIDD